MFSIDELFEILSWLPAKPLIRFSSVSKSIFNLLNDDKFIQHHCHNWFTGKLHDDGYGFFIQSSVSDSYPGIEPDLHWLLSSAEKRTASVPDSSIAYMKENFRVLASSNGLVLCRAISSSELFLCNPATKSTVHIGLPEFSRRRLSIPHSIRNPLNVAFFIHDHSNDYSVWVFEYEEKAWKAYKFDQDCGLWRVQGSIHTGGRNLAMDMPPIHVDGELFFASDCGKYMMKSSPLYLPYIIACDVENSTHRIIKLPRDAYRGFERAEMCLFPWEEEHKTTSSSICLVRMLGLTLTVWVLGDVNRRKSWRRVDKIRLKSLGLNIHDRRISGCLVMRGWLIFATSKKIYKYRLIEKNYRQFHDRRREFHDIGTHNSSCSRVLMDVYVNTMRSCGDPTTNYQHDDEDDDDLHVFYQRPTTQLVDCVADFVEYEE